MSKVYWSISKPNNEALMFDMYNKKAFVFLVHL